MAFLPRSSKSFEMDHGSHDSVDRRPDSCVRLTTDEESKSPRTASQPTVPTDLANLPNIGDGGNTINNSREEQSGRRHNNGVDKSRLPSLRYTVIDVPPWHVCLVLGFQHYLTMLGSTIVIPALLVPAMGGTPKDHARVVQTIFFVSGLNTLIQTTIGDRLPIVQGGSFSFLKPAFSIIAIIKSTMEFRSEHDRFVYTMRELQGSIIGSSLVVMAIGYSGAMGALLRFVSPIVVAPTVCMVGLSLYSAGFPEVTACVEQGLLSIVAVIIFSQVLKKVEVPLPRWLLPSRFPPLLGGTDASPSSPLVDLGRTSSSGRRRGGGDGGSVRIFELFPLLWSILLSWAVAGILTAAGAYDNTSPERQASCRTDNMQAVNVAPWLYVPYPLQWGMPIFRPASIITMLAGTLAAMIESTGDYYACARMCGAPVPPPYVISRGIGAEGMGCFMCGLFGTGNGTTSYAENIGAIGLTGVGSRRVVQAGAAIMLFLAIFGKFGGMFASLPPSIVSGLFCCVFGLIAAVGLSNLQFTDQNSSRNLFIVGFAIYMSLSIPYYFDSYTSVHGGIGPIATSSHAFNDIANTLFSTPMCVALICAFVLDNLVSGTPTERGLKHWSALVGTVETHKRAAARPDDGVAEDAATDMDVHSVTPTGGPCTGAGGTLRDAGDYSTDSGSDDDDPSMDPRNDVRIKAVYDLPHFLQLVNDRYILPRRRAAQLGLRRLSRVVRQRWRRLVRRMLACCGSSAAWIFRGARCDRSVRVPTSASSYATSDDDDATLPGTAPYSNFK
ncbi:hypothetical protein VaNZ11_008241 [Volvox africanus]|uniref:Uncharacterized protein n=1 Tax=Volvox africanus TaxID=51714 RepID=A0ABQ5S591_9CHLO|nr:hypothetical protein VaNZ11_008241 [Volvox africanus]